MNRHMIRISPAMLLVSVMIAPAVVAQKVYDPGATDSEIKIGNIMAYTGWAQQYGAVGRAEAAYFQMVNDRGGVNGRKINFISVDNGSDAAKSVALTRQLVEQNGVLLIFSSIGTDSNLAIRAYMNEKRVPQLFVESSSAVFDDPSHFPWTMGFFATYRTEGSAYAKYILQNKPGAKIAVLYANDDAGKEYLAGVRGGLGDKASAMIVKEASYQASDAALDSQIMTLKPRGPTSSSTCRLARLRPRPFAPLTTSTGTRCSSFPTLRCRSLRSSIPRDSRRQQESSRMRGPRAGASRKCEATRRCASFWNG